MARESSHLKKKKHCKKFKIPVLSIQQMLQHMILISIHSETTYYNHQTTENPTKSHSSRIPPSITIL
ncbi:hypothetical protein CARUB_v10025128mg [Capsella rubella]|uniref:Uncharacterized protein n=1 Tax=Capsella rubella TaxID=81985 RepID=R0HXT7_9BRAS|nr:hypothetical protein CARUB_v10025128mg [Capsella rubella]